jgi:DNA-binding XRE family transcriptional regulator
MSALEYKALRARLGLTQAGLAGLLGVSRRTIIFRETGARITEEAALAIRALAASSPK